MHQELSAAKSRYQEIATAHMTERLDALHDAERRRAAAEPSTNSFHEAAADEKAIADEIWSEADQIDRGARRASEA